MLERRGPLGSFTAAAAVAMVALLVVLAGCGGAGNQSTDDPSDGTSSSDETSSTDDSNDDSTDDSGDDSGDDSTDDSTDNEDREFSDDPFSPDAAVDDYPTSPMSEFLGYDDMDSDEQEERYRQEELDRQQVIAECMRAEGFEYTVFVYDQSFSFESPYQDMTRREFVEKYGFGISTTFEDDFAPPEASPDQQEINPNDEYVNGLSEGEQEAYYEALYGPPQEEPPMEETVGTDGEPVEVEYEYVPQGCDGKAYEDQSPPEDQEFLEDISALMSTEIYERVQADSRVVDATKAYAECMSDAGHPEITNQEDTYNEVSTRMEPIYNSMDGGFVYEEKAIDDESGGATIAAAAPAAAPAPGDTVDDGAPTYDEALLAQVQAYELALAAADLECGADLQRTMYEVSSEYEEEFIAAHGDEMARYKELATP